MSKNIPSTSKSSESKDNSPLDPYAELEKLKILNDEINKKMMMGPPLLNPTCDTSNEMLGMVLDELKEMRKEMKKDVRLIKLIIFLIVFFFISFSEVRNVRNDVTGIKKALEEVQRNQQNQQLHLHELKVNVSSIQKDSKKEPESYSETDIRRHFNGKWRNVNHHNNYFSAKFEGDTFMIKWNKSYDKYTLGVKNPYGCTVTVENNKIVKRCFTNHGEEEWRREYYIENERLQGMDYYYGKKKWQFIFERDGDPDQ